MSLDFIDTRMMSDTTLAWPTKLINELVSDVRVIYSDIDGTLFGPGGCLFKDSGHGFTDAPALAIVQCHINNIDIVPVSGRSNKQLRSDSRILGFNSWISELGCQLVYDNGETTVLNTGDIQETDFTVWELILDGGAPDLLLREFPGRLEYHDPWAQGRDCTHLFRGQIDIEHANELLLSNNFKNLCIIDNGRVRRRGKSLDSSITEIRAYHLLPRVSNKASAVRKDIATRGVKISHTIAIGDSEADLELANEVGALFLVKNALNDSPRLIEKIRDFGNVFITSAEMGLGWTEVVRYFLERKI
jgi:hydroxymethylpyrimidine pyrophosphatase-like HAD family hydrolase